MDISKHPISNIEWRDVTELSANDYNPNTVLTPELKLLRFSLLAQGWLQPILITKEGVIIDGFHRSTLAKIDPSVGAMTNGKVPCVVMDLDEPERMLLTIRINRAKGTHSAVKMHDIVYKLYNEHLLTKQQIGDGIGAHVDEVDVLLQQGVFDALDTANKAYSEAWGVTKA